MLYTNITPGYSAGGGQSGLRCVPRDLPAQISVWPLLRPGVEASSGKTPLTPHSWEANAAHLADAAEANKERVEEWEVSIPA